MTTTNKKTLFAAAIVIMLVAILATVAFTMFDGIAAGRKSHPSGNSPSSGQVVTLPAADSSGNVAQGNVALGAPTGSGTAILQPYPGPGPFQPGPPPFGQTGTSGDGLSAWGVAFKQTSDANAQSDTDLIKSAYQDAQKKADALASATGIKLGKLVAISDYTQGQPYYDKPCIQSYSPPKGSATGSGSSGSAPAIRGQAQVAPEPPQPAPAPCQVQRYLVAWVLVRYQIGS